ncbi:hypothetical protein LP422_08995 [Janibacter limosus]|uniref:Uncharacterized protein n=1 Tax=Janibacter limosus TaxID=53458 RepID=A0AC61U7S4_9MICO|nr:hypothetical protein [Janibacter limosus]UUZ45989.1 hypothetical protein LP422_08995 [Janibacter limosus]
MIVLVDDGADLRGEDRATEVGVAERLPAAVEALVAGVEVADAAVLLVRAQRKSAKGVGRRLDESLAGYPRGYALMCAYVVRTLRELKEAS